MTFLLRLFLALIVLVGLAVYVGASIVTYMGDLSAAHEAAIGRADK